jgi:superfamily II DNA or RNA helicase
MYIRNLAWNLKGNTLILFQFVDKHGQVLYDMLNKSEEHAVHFVHGGVNTDEREAIRLDVRKARGNIICASYGTFSTGINIPELDNLIFASPSKGRIRNLQSIGRVLRKGNDKSSATLYDIADDLQWKNTQNFAVRHFIERVKIYNDEGFDFKIYNVDVKG